MKISIPLSKDHASKMATRWNIRLLDKIAENNRTAIYKTEDAKGLYALKVLKTFGDSGEGGAKLFLDALPTGTAVRMHRVNMLRTAFLMDWLEGPTLDQLFAEGEEEKALSLLAQSAGIVNKTNFKYPFLYRSITPKFTKTFDKAAGKLGAPEAEPDLARARKILTHLLDTMRREHVIHGDLGLQNVILTADGPRIIDPKGFRADATYECCTTIAPDYTKTSVADYKAGIVHRASITAPALGEDPKRMIQWGAVSLARRIYRRDPQRPDAVRRKPYLAAFLELAEA